MLSKLGRPKLGRKAVIRMETSCVATDSTATQSALPHTVSQDQRFVRPRQLVGPEGDQSMIL